MEALIDVRGLHTGYGGIAVVRDMDLQVHAGEVVALLGPNGAGKTTTLLTISGLLRPISGTVTVLGETVEGGKPHRVARRGLAHVAEDRSLFFDLTVQENLRLGLTGDKSKRAAAYDRAMELFPVLAPLRVQRAGLLSGGEQQMLAMARGLATDPGLLLIDELSMGLAPLIVAELYELVAGIAREGVSILVVEQFARTVLGVADVAVIMQHGRVTAVGAPTELEQELSAAYLGATP